MLSGPPSRRGSSGKRQEPWVALREGAGAVESLWQKGQRIRGGDFLWALLQCINGNWCMDIPPLDVKVHQTLNLRWCMSALASKNI